MDYDEVRNFLEKTNTDLMKDNNNYKTQNYIYYFLEDHIEYDALIQFQNSTIRGIILPLLEKKYQTTLFQFHLNLMIYPKYIVCKLKSHTPNLVDATLIVRNCAEEDQQEFDIIIQDLKFIYQESTPKLLVDGITYMVKAMIRSDIKHFIKIMKNYQLSIT
jgi:hypothetical protein